MFKPYDITKISAANNSDRYQSICPLLTIYKLTCIFFLLHMLLLTKLISLEYFSYNYAITAGKQFYYNERTSYPTYNFTSMHVLESFFIFWKGCYILSFQEIHSSVHHPVPQ